MNSELDSYSFIETETFQPEEFARTEPAPYPVAIGTQPELRGDGLPTPMPPNTMAETGITESTVEQLILKQLYFKGEAMGRDISNALGFKYSVIEPMVETMKRNHLMVAKRSMGMGNMSTVFVLSEAGRKLVHQYLEINSYAGAAPVSLDEYCEIVKLQKLDPGWLTKEALNAAYSHMVVSEEILSQIGPAVNSGKSFLIYGQPGNGKTFLAEALFNINISPIYIPYAIECQDHRPE